ncbi:ZIP family metal transporter [Fodinibius halophilus]|uniref:ZIP family metal transporter n=1 Tax=Fodinibius halophilus TaxID=1736908 RepID=A0A6M1TAN9_9BACT|nr:ZIP family metal transporter [Fodinibius halophilus]NGP89483.1 ZIP family metal transporter [Fodinibius halophilus]
MSELLQQPATDVFLYALITAVATGLGAIPFFFFKKLTRSWLGISNAIASGLMLAASFGLIYEGLNYDLWFTFYGILIGLAFIVISQKILNGYEDQFGIKNISQADSTKMLLIVGIMTLHSFTEGVSVGVSFSGGLDLGLFITTAIAVHNIPEGLAICLVLIPRSTTPLKAMWWSIFSSLPQPLMAVPAFLFVEIFRTYLPMGLGFAGGAMIWMVFAELIPDALEDTDSSTVATTITISVALMIVFQVLIG